MPAESQLRTKIIQALRIRGGVWFVTHADAFGQRGIPDIMGCVEGEFYGLEVKMPGKLATLTPAQKRTLEQIELAGGRATVVTTVVEALDFVFS